MKNGNKSNEITTNSNLTRDLNNKKPHKNKRRRRTQTEEKTGFNQRKLKEKKNAMPKNTQNNIQAKKMIEMKTTDIEKMDKGKC